MTIQRLMPFMLMAHHGGLIRVVVVHKMRFIVRSLPSNRLCFGSTAKPPTQVQTLSIKFHPRVGCDYKMSYDNIMSQATHVDWEGFDLNVSLLLLF